MTGKDYEVISHALFRSKPLLREHQDKHNQYKLTCIMLAQNLKRSYVNFNYDEFLEEC